MFLLRPWRETDAVSLTRYADNLKIAVNLRDAFPYPYTPADAEAYVRGCMEREGERQLCRAIVINGEAAGSIGVFLGNDVYRKSAELGYWLGEPFWGRGIMTAAVEQICLDAFRRFDIVRMYAEPYAQNMGSRRVLEKTGFTLEGTLRRRVYKCGEFWDSCLYALMREEACI